MSDDDARSRSSHRVLWHGALGDANIEVNEVPLWVACYRFRTADGREATGLTRPAPRSEVSRWASGDEIDVRYDPAHPEQSAALDEA